MKAPGFVARYARYVFLGYVFVVEEFVEHFGQSFFFGGEKFVGCAKEGALQSTL